MRGSHEDRVDDAAPRGERGQGLDLRPFAVDRHRAQPRPVCHEDRTVRGQPGVLDRDVRAIEGAGE